MDHDPLAEQQPPFLTRFSAARQRVQIIAQRDWYRNQILAQLLWPHCKSIGATTSRTRSISFVIPCFHIRGNKPLHLLCNSCFSSSKVHCEFPNPILWLFCLAMKTKKNKKSLKKEKVQIYVEGQRGYCFPEVKEKATSRLQSLHDEKPKWTTGRWKSVFHKTLQTEFKVGSWGGARRSPKTPCPQLLTAASSAAAASGAAQKQSKKILALQWPVALRRTSGNRKSWF